MVIDGHTITNFAKKAYGDVDMNIILEKSTPRSSSGARVAPMAVAASAARIKASKTVSAPGQGREIWPCFRRISKTGIKRINGYSASGRT